MLTLTGVIGLWAMAKPVNLPRRARLAVNATLAMAGVQVHVDYKYILAIHFSIIPFSFLGFTWDINLAILCSSPLGRVASIRFLGPTYVYPVVWTRN